ncbi:MAG: DUF1947 domain-containing protein [Candidatus Woesearchaeota archaeon]
MRRKQLSKAEIKEFADKLCALYPGYQLSKKDQVELVDEKIILINRQSSFFLREGVPVPTLRLLLKNQFLKTLVVDMGAVGFVAEGADVMRPGIVGFDNDITEGEFVAVVDLQNRKPLAVCQAVMSSEQLKSTGSGKSCKNLHHVGDEIWSVT